MPAAKATLLAQLATARAKLWCALLAVSEHALSAQPVAGSWTPKDILAHLAFWDDFRAGQLALMLAARVDQITMPDTDARNAQVYVQYHDWSLERIVDQAQEARAGFLATLDPLSEQDLGKTFILPSAGSVTVRAWIERRINHDRLHLGPILDWRAAASSRAVGPKCVLVAALDSAGSALLAWRWVLSDGELTTRPVAGSRTYQDIAAHVAHWQDWIVHSIQEIQSGRIAGQRLDSDVGAWTTNRLEAGRDQPFAVTWHDLVEGRWALTELLEGFDDTQLAQPVETTLEAFEQFYFWFSSAAEQYQEQAEAMEAGLVIG